MDKTINAIIADAQGLKKPLRERGAICVEQLLECEDLADAYRLCQAVSGKELKQIAAEVGYPYEALAKVLRRNMEGADRRYMPGNVLIPFMAACGNSIPLQWLMLQWQLLTGSVPVVGGVARVAEALGLGDRLARVEEDVREILAAVREMNVDGGSLAVSGWPVWLLTELAATEAELAGGVR